MTLRTLTTYSWLTRHRNGKLFGGALLLSGVALAACSSEDPAAPNDPSNTSGPSGGTVNTTASNTTAGASNTTTGGPGVTNTTDVGASNTTTNAGTNTTTTGTTGATATVGGVTTNTGSGGASTTGSASTGASGDCGITVMSQEVSTAIPTVGIVTWSATGTIDSAEIQFGPAGGGFTMTAPVDLSEPNYRTLLLGMKEQSTYNFQIVAQSGGQPCTSDTLSIDTGPVSNQVPTIDREVMMPDQVDPGFYVTIDYTSGLAYILDSDGDPVWWAEGPGNSSGVRIDWQSKYMWVVTGNPSGGMGQLRRISMDGLEVDNIPNQDAHHDIAPLPDGSVVALVHTGGNCSSIVKVGTDLSVTPIVPDVSTIYTPVMQCHPNSVLYHPNDESLTVSDRNPNLYVKITMTGEVVWQFGGSNPLGPHIQATWNVNHGHHLLDDGHFLFFNNNGNGNGNGSQMLEFQLDVSGLTATQVGQYQPSSNDSSFSLGDVQRLDNGNTLITFSNQGTIHEINPEGQVVQIMYTEALGYVQHRKSLYGPPPK